jgi:uncharacterized membrane protein
MMTMQFATAPPSWMLLLLAAGIMLIAWASYAGAIVPLGSRRRAALVGLRALTLLLLVSCLLRPVRIIPPDREADAVVPILLDASRSMSLSDVDGQPRIEAARQLLQQIQPALQQRFRTEVWTFGDDLARLETDGVPATQRHSDLSGALRALRERYRERRVAGVLVFSDGGDTGTQEAATAVEDGAVPVYAVGVGAPRVDADLEVLDVSAGELALAESSIDLTVAAISRGSAAPFDIRILENGRPIDVRRVTPAGDGSPVRAVFTVSPPRETAAVYTVEIPSAAGELVGDNNRRSVLVEPPGPRRRILMIEGAPGFEHAFIKRALSTDSGIELDSVGRKGRDSRGDATYFVQADGARAPRLATGFPQERAALYEYDAVILANLEGDALSRGQLQMLADFVDTRGGGLLVLGARSFAQQGYAGTPLDDVLPLQLTGRGTGVVRASAVDGPRLAVRLTSGGMSHPVMRIDDPTGDMQKRWAALPALAGVTSLGALRPGAEALALVSGPDGLRPLVAVQRYGQGRAMVFAGEASWRWRMQMPSTDRSYEMFWRQAGRWIAAGAPPPVSSVVLPAAGGRTTVAVHVHEDDFRPVGNADVPLRITHPDGRVEEASARIDDAQAGRYTAEFKFDAPGIYRVAATARRDGSPLGAHERWLLVGGSDLEMADPRLNADVLTRVAVASGGAYVNAVDVARLPELLAAAAAAPASPRMEELWNTPWVFGFIVLLLGTEWVLRRQWGLR